MLIDAVFGDNFDIVWGVVVFLLIFPRVMMIILGRGSNVTLEERDLILVALRDHYFRLASYNLTALDLLILQL